MLAAPVAPLRPLGCPATSATVERLFSAVGHAYDDKRQSAGAGTLQSRMFTKANVPSRPNGKIEIINIYYSIYSRNYRPGNTRG